MKELELIAYCLSLMSEEDYNLMLAFMAGATFKAAGEQRNKVRRKRYGKADESKRCACKGADRPFGL